jgi:hypothetical protein
MHLLTINYAFWHLRQCMIKLYEYCICEWYVLSNRIEKGTKYVEWYIKVVKDTYLVIGLKMVLRIKLIDILST